MSKSLTNIESVIPRLVASLRAVRIRSGGKEIPAALARLCGGILGYAMAKNWRTLLKIIKGCKDKNRVFTYFFLRGSLREELVILVKCAIFPS